MASLPPIWQSTIERFRDEFGAEPTHGALAPGRVNLIGEHTDYQGGFVFPAAIDRYVCVVAKQTSEETVLVSGNKKGRAIFDTKSLEKSKSWRDYPAGMAWALSTVSGKEMPNLQALIETNLPIGAGLSSSAAIEMAFGTLWRLMSESDIPDAELALLGQKAENEFVGMKCGIMDQTASLFGREGHALFVDTSQPGNPEAVPLPAGISLVVCDTRVKHQLTGSEYNDRREQTEEAARILGVKWLRDASIDLLESKRPELTDLLYRRAKHVVTENVRTVKFKDALVAGELTKLHQLMAEAHTSMQVDFEATCFELDVMAVAAQEYEGCLGARMMGGGFGGSCIALVENEMVPSFVTDVESAYFSRTGIKPELRVCVAVDGARAYSIG